MKHSHDFTHDPVGHRHHCDRIHVVRINIAPDVTDIPVVAHVVERTGGPNNPADLTPEGAPSKLRLGGVLLSRKNTYSSPTLFPAPPSSQFGNRSSVRPLSS